MHPAALAPLLALLVGIPSLRDHFPDSGSPTHEFLLVDSESGEVLRAEGAAGDELPSSGTGETVPLPGHAWGDLARVVDALAGLEDGILDAETRVRCDSTCWAKGSHGEVGLVEALAWGCDTWWGAQGSRVPRASFVRHARAIGFAPTDSANASSLAAWVSFWRRLLHEDLHLAPNTSTQLLAAAGMSVSSPRGAARALDDPRRRTRAFVGGGPEGAWVVGSREVLGRVWVFALFLPGGSPALAVARTDALLEETRDIARRSTAQRGGMPTNEPK
ncbi:MAG: hypothetical protein U0167_04585 [bacterium]